VALHQWAVSYSRTRSRIFFCGSSKNASDSQNDHVFRWREVHSIAEFLAPHRFQIVGHFYSRLGKDLYARSVIPSGWLELVYSVESERARLWLNSRKKNSLEVLVRERDDLVLPFSLRKARRSQIQSSQPSELDTPLPSAIEASSIVTVRQTPDFFWSTTDYGNLNAYKMIEEPAGRIEFVDYLDQAERKALFSLLMEDPEVAGSGDRPRARLEVSKLDEAFFEYLRLHPNAFYDLSPSRFEEVVGGILKDMGCQVTPTPRTRDGGRDLLAVYSTPLGEMLTLVECKLYAAHRRVGIEIIERFLWTIQEDRATCGIIVTTSSFSSVALEKARQFSYKLKLRDFADLKEWIGNYGKWSASSESGIWLPNRGVL
jgi:Restriction endonuclease